MSAKNAGPMIVKIGGRTLEEQSSLPELWKALVSLAASLSGGVVLVHGGGKAVDRLLSRLGIVSERRAGLRVTPPDQLELITGVLAGSTNKALVGCLNRAGGAAVGLCLGDGAMTRCEKIVPGGVDLGRVGEIVGGEGRLVRMLLRDGFIPVVSSIGLDEAGTALNVNADDGAAGLARILGASGLVLLTDVPGIKDGAGRVLAEVTPREIERLIKTGEIGGGMIVKARAAAKLTTETGIPVVILSGDDPAQLVRWIGTGEGGTKIAAERSPAAHASRAGKES